MATLKINKETGILEVIGKRHRLNGFSLKDGKKLEFPLIKVIMEKKNGQKNESEKERNVYCL
jgi:hypothetical protein